MVDARIINQFLLREQLPASYRHDIDDYLMNLTRQLDETLNGRDQSGPPLVVGINGAQGTGKSTLARFLQIALENSLHESAGNVGKCIVNLSIDDFYWSRNARRQLAREVHPLLATRGVPGTHDVLLAMATLNALLASGQGTEVALPRFDKATDDPVPKTEWPLIRGKVDLIILEGWFVGAMPEPVENLSTAINSLEEKQDSDGRWRRYVNQQLAGPYQELFKHLDLLIMLKAPDFKQVLQWRRLQEQKLAQQSPKSGNQLMNPQQISQFIQFFQRLTVHCLETLPPEADLVLLLDEHHRIIGQMNQLS